MLWLQRIENTIKDELRQKQLIPRANLAGHPTLHVHNIRARGEAQSTQNAFSTFELFKLQNVVRRLNLLLDRPHP